MKPEELTIALNFLEKRFGEADIKYASPSSPNRIMLQLMRAHHIKAAPFL